MAKPIDTRLTPGPVDAESPRIGTVLTLVHSALVDLESEPWYDGYRNMHTEET